MDTAGGWFLGCFSFLSFFFFKATQTTQHYGGNRSSPSLTFSTTVSPSFLSANSSRLPRYQDSPETACPGSCQILCARMSVGPSEVPAASESSISTRNMEKRREEKRSRQHAPTSKPALKIPAKSLLSTKGSEREREGGFLLSSESCVKITSSTSYHAKRT